MSIAGLYNQRWGGAGLGLAAAHLGDVWPVAVVHPAGVRPAVVPLAGVQLDSDQLPAGDVRPVAADHLAGVRPVAADHPGGVRPAVLPLAGVRPAVLPLAGVRPAVAHLAWTLSGPLHR